MKKIFVLIRASILISSFVVFLATAAVFLIPLVSFSDDTAIFFSPERIRPNPEMISALRARDDGRVQKDIADFSRHYNKGFEEYEQGSFGRASESFKRARRVWPEYFYSDFAIALMYENKREYGTAARYYKSYLNKLRSYQQGKYRIFASLIASFSPGYIEDYNFAYSAVKRRLARHDINIEKTRPAFSFSPFLAGIIIFLVVVAGYFLVFHLVVPYTRKMVRIKNPPEGFWVCPNCEEISPDLSFVCSNCGKPKPGVRHKKGSDG